MDVERARASWRVLSDGEQGRLFHEFNRRFAFDRSGGLEAPVIRDPVPSVTFSLNGLTAGSSYATAAASIQAEGMRCFVTALPEATKLFVFDYFHDSFELDVEAEVLDPLPQPSNSWYPTIYPNGDYYGYFTKDLTEGTFGHPWEASICVFGERMVGSLARSLATWLPVIRVDGVSADHWVG